MLDQNPSRSSAVFLQKSARLIREGRLGTLDQYTPVAEYPDRILCGPWVSSGLALNSEENKKNKMRCTK